jgi:hypothetical protein
MQEFWRWFGITVGACVGLSIFVWVIMFSIMLYKDFDRGMAMLGGLTMFFRGVRKKESSRKHRRKTDTVEHEHVRRTSRPSMMMTITDFVRNRNKGDGNAG